MNVGVQIQVETKLTLEVIPGCPSCHQPNLARLAYCSCGTKIPPSRFIDTDAKISGSHIARAFLAMGNFLRRIDHTLRSILP